MRHDGEILTAVVLVGSIAPVHMVIQAVSFSRHAHIYFTTSKGRVIDSTAKHGGVTVHPPASYPISWEYSRNLLEFYTLGDVERMTERAFSLIGTKYDMPGEYLANNPSANWQAQLWCFEFGRAVMDGYLTFDHRPDRAVGRHWLKALKSLR